MHIQPALRRDRRRHRHDLRQALRQQLQRSPQASALGHGLRAVLGAPLLRSAGRSVLLGLVGGVLLGLALAVSAQAVRGLPATLSTEPGAAPRAKPMLDPTRPPVGMPTSARQGGSAGALPGLPGLSLNGLIAPAAPYQGQPLAALPAASRPAPPEKPRLQALHLPHGGEASAMVDGRIVKVGDKVGDLVVAEISADDVLMRGQRGTERWSLLNADNARALAETRSGREPRAKEPAQQGEPATHVAGRKEP